MNELEQRLIDKEAQIDDYQLKVEHQERQIQELQIKLEMVVQQGEK